jgi:predicted transcriptional regulator YdeE
MTTDALQPARYEDGRAILLAGLRRHHEFEESVRTIPEQWQELRSLGAMPGQIGANTYGVICGEHPGGFEYLCGAEVESFAGLPDNMGRMRLTPQHYAVFLHSGPIANLRGTWQRIFRDWLPGSGFDSAQKPDFELYDQRFDPRTRQGVVEIWIAITRDRTSGVPVA